MYCTLVEPSRAQLFIKVCCELCRQKLPGASLRLWGTHSILPAPARVPSQNSSRFDDASALTVGDDQTTPTTTPTSTRALPLGETTGTPADTPGLRAAVHSSRRTSRRVAAGGERVRGERGVRENAVRGKEGCAVPGSGRVYSRERARREGERGSGGS